MGVLTYKITTVRIRDINTITSFVLELVPIGVKMNSTHTHKMRFYVLGFFSKLLTPLIYRSKPSEMIVGAISLTCFIDNSVNKPDKDDYLLLYSTHLLQCSLVLLKSKVHFFLLLSLKKIYLKEIIRVYYCSFDFLVVQFSLDCSKTAGFPVPYDNFLKFINFRAML